MTRLIDLPLSPGLTPDDLLYVVNDPAGTATDQKAPVSQFLALVQAAIPVINVLDYGAVGDGVTDDTPAVQNAFNAAYDLGVARIVFPRTAISRYMFGNTVINTTSPVRGRVPSVTNVNTGTDVITFDSPHLLVTGDSIRFKGYAWGGITIGTQYFANKQSDTTIKLYNTKANALAGGATGLIDCTSGVTTTGNINSTSNQLTVVAVLNAQKGTSVKIAGVTNSNGAYFVRSIAGSVITLNANANVTVGPGTAVTFVSVMDWRDYRTGFQIEVAEGVSLAKLTGFSGTSILSLSDAHSIILRGGSFYGLTPEDGAAINPGDDLLRFNSNRLLWISGVKMHNAGDAALRISTSTGDPVGATASDPTAGIGTQIVWVERCYTQNCHQWSTTTNDYMHGGGSEVYYDKNVFDNLRGSCKLASRTPGAKNVFLTNNIFRSGLDKGFEIDSYSSIHCQGNIFQNIPNFPFFLTPNNGPAAVPSGDGSGVTGFAFGYLKFYDNWFIGCATTASNACIRLNMDIYSDGFRWDYDGVDISRNHFIDVNTTSSFGITILGSSVKNLRIKDNEFLNFNGAIACRLFLRGSTTPGFINNIDVSDNIFRMTNAAATSIWLQLSGGTELISEVHLNDNKFYGTCVASMVLGNLKNVFVDRNRASLTGGFFLQVNTGQPVQDLHVTRNRMDTSGNTGWLFSEITGLFVEDNVTKTTAGTTYSIANTCTNVWFDPKRNRSVGGTANVRQVPINSNGIGATGRGEFGSAAPAGGTWNVGDTVNSQAAVTGQPIGFRCTVKGTAGSIAAGTTATTDGVTNTFTVGSVANLAVGTFINVAGAWAGGRTITVINTSTLAVTVDGGTPSAVAGGAVTYVNPTFVNLPNVP